MNKLKRLWINLRESFWFVPSIIVAFSIILALGLIEYDSSSSRDWIADWPRLFGVGAAGARGMLATIAGSMMTVVGVTFSMTLMTLALASSQYSSRILRNFMSDHATQVVLGIFTGTFTYCLIVLRTIRGDDEGTFVPSLSVAFSVVLAIGGIGTLIFFIHHIATSIQASSIIAAVAKETIAAVDRLFPEKLGQGPMNDEANLSLHPLPVRSWQTIRVNHHGYIQSVDNTALLRLAREHKTIVRMECGIGEFVVQDSPLVSIAQDEPLDEDLIAALRATYTIDRNCTVHQDCTFGIRQLVDIALRALSPAVNDTSTAVMCVNYLTAILTQLASREFPSERRYEDGQLRVITIVQTFASLVAESFDDIRGSATGNVAILLRMLAAFQTIYILTESPSHRQVLREHTQCIADVAARSIESPRDQARFASQLARVHIMIETKTSDRLQTW